MWTFLFFQSSVIRLTNFKMSTWLEKWAYIMIIIVCFSILLIILICLVLLFWKRSKKAFDCLSENNEAALSKCDGPQSECQFCLTQHFKGNNFETKLHKKNEVSNLKAASRSANLLNDSVKTKLNESAKLANYDNNVNDINIRVNSNLTYKMTINITNLLSKWGSQPIWLLKSASSAHLNGAV